MVVGVAPATCFHIANRTAASDSPARAKPRSSASSVDADHHPPRGSGVGFDVLRQRQRRAGSVTATET